MTNLNSPDNGVTNKPSEPLSYLPSTDISESFLWEIRSRERWILEIGGERVQLLKRRYEGLKCVDCWDEVRKQARVSDDCLTCYGTGIVDGYYDPIEILVSLVDPAVNKINIQEHGMRKEITPRSWTLWEPLISNKDIIVTKLNSRRYWINNVTPSTFRGIPLHQSMDLELVENTNIIYKFPIQW